MYRWIYTINNFVLFSLILNSLYILAMALSPLPARTASIWKSYSPGHLGLLWPGYQEKVACSENNRNHNHVIHLLRKRTQNHKTQCMAINGELTHNTYYILLNDFQIVLPILSRQHMPILKLDTSWGVTNKTERIYLQCKNTSWSESEIY